MGAFEDLHRDRVTGSLAMFDRMIFKGHLSALYKQDGALFLVVRACGAQGLHRLRQIHHRADRQQRPEAGDRRWRPVISFDHVKTRNRTQHRPLRDASSTRFSSPRWWLPNAIRR